MVESLPASTRAVRAGDWPHRRGQSVCGREVVARGALAGACLREGDVVLEELPSCWCVHAIVDVRRYAGGVTGDGVGNEQLRRRAAEEVAAARVAVTGPAVAV